MSINISRKVIYRLFFRCFVIVIIPLIFVIIFNNRTTGQVRINSGTNLINTGNFVVKDIAIINNGTFSNSQGTISFGGSEISYVGGNGENIFNNLSINKSVNTAKVMLSSNITLNGTLTITNGDLDLYDKILTLGSSAVISGESNNNIIFSSFTNGSRGYITTTRNFSSPLNSETFGNIGILLSTAEATGSTTAMRFFDAAAIDSYSGMSKQFSIIPANNTGLNANLIMNYFAAECQGLNPSGMEAYYSGNGGGLWERTASITSFNSETQSGTLSISGLSSFPLDNKWTASDDSHPLPVELSSFTGSVNKRDVLLKWVTESENNNAGFEIQRALINPGNLNWVQAGFINGNGTKNEPVTYSFNDRKVNSGVYKYRLKQIDFNGNTEYFDLESKLEIETPNSFSLGQNYPNPFNPHTKIDFQVPKNALVSIKIFDITGRELKTIVNEIKEPGYYTASFYASGFSSGVYFYRMTAGTYSKILKMTVLK